MGASEKSTDWYLAKLKHVLSDEVPDDLMREIATALHSDGIMDIHLAEAALRGAAPQVRELVLDQVRNLDGHAAGGD